MQKKKTSPSEIVRESETCGFFVSGPHVWSHCLKTGGPILQMENHLSVLSIVRAYTRTEIHPKSDAASAFSKFVH